MKLKKLVIVFTLAALIVIGSGIFMNTAAYDIPSSEESELQDTVLTIVTRHDIVITTEFEARFLETPEAIYLGITDIDFKQATTDEGWKTLLKDPSRGIDLAWGGGPSLFNTESLGPPSGTSVFLYKYVFGSPFKLKNTSSVNTWFTAAPEKPPS